ncbi:MAG: dihydropteroate synthase [Gammaproteobacteria bacterium]|nr:MAG: dihydropteroate synthase [Gammaproteobacteria bacterium]
MSEHVLFLTGRLARKSLQRVLESMEAPGFTWTIHDIGLNVAALMTAEMIGRRLKDLYGADRVILPGLCRGDLEELERRFGVRFERGPVDLKDLPGFFGQGRRQTSLERYRVRIFAEIVDAPGIPVAEVLARAKRYVGEGADVIDIGCLPTTEFPHLEDTVAALKEAGYTVSVDSMDEQELLRGGRAGADYLLSLKESSLWIADEVGSVPVLIPERPGDLPSLYRAIEGMQGRGRECYADSILDPIHFGFTESICRYRRLREDHPEVPVMMGTGNVTELTEADTTGINALLFGIISELSIDAVLTTEVSPHCRTVVRESDRARRIMYAAREDNALPKGYDEGLTTTHLRRPWTYTPEEVEELAGQIRDPSYRVVVSEAGIHVFNRDGLHTAVDPFRLFPQLERLQEDAPHAFYMGVELARAQVAWQLGRRYMQDQELDWGVAARPVDSEVDMHAYKEAGSTLKAGRRRKKKGEE